MISMREAEEHARQVERDINEENQLTLEEVWAGSRRRRLPPGVLLLVQHMLHHHPTSDFLIRNGNIHLVQSRIYNDDNNGQDSDGEDSAVFSPSFSPVALSEGGERRHHVILPEGFMDEIDARPIPFSRLPRSIQENSEA